MNELDLNHKKIRKAILKSQHCQRNFDLNQKFPEEDIELMKIAVTQAPSKQNLAFYKAYFIFDRDTIENIHIHTKGFGIDPKNYQTNSQTLANLLVIFIDNPVHLRRNEESIKYIKGKANESDISTLKKDRDQSIGIASGYLNLTASLLGYFTGCCGCFDTSAIKTILKIKDTPLLMMGVGFKDSSRNRRQHHKDKNFIFPSFQKQMIEIHTIEQQSASAI